MGPAGPSGESVFGPEIEQDDLATVVAELEVFSVLIVAFDLLGLFADGPSGSADTTALVWDLTGRAEGMIPPIKLTQELLMTTLHALGDENPAPAHRALWTLVAAAKQSVPLLDKQLEPAPERKRLALLIAALNHERIAETHNPSAGAAAERLPVPGPRSG